MKRSAKIGLAAGLLAVSALAVTGFAVAKGGWHHGFRDGGGFHEFGGMHGERGPGHYMHYLNLYDADRDGTLSRVETESGRADDFARFDADGDGALSLDEYRGLWLETMNARMVDRFQFFDEDGDAAITADEFTTPVSYMLNFMDRNEDGMIDEMDRHRGDRWHDRGRHWDDDDRGPRDD